MYTIRVVTAFLRFKGEKCIMYADYTTSSTFLINDGNPKSFSIIFIIVFISLKTEDYTRLTGRKPFDLKNS